jgi:hypothetical protein
VLDSHVFQPNNVLVRQEFEELDFTEGCDGKLRVLAVAVAMSAVPTYAVFFVIDYNLLEGDECVSLSRARAVYLTGCLVSIPQRCVSPSRSCIPKGALAKLAQYLVLADVGATMEAGRVAGVLAGKGSRRLAAEYALHGGGRCSGAPLGGGAHSQSLAPLLRILKGAVEAIRVEASAGWLTGCWTKVCRRRDDGWWDFAAGCVDKVWFLGIGVIIIGRDVASVRVNWERKGQW